jgi:Zn-dependent M28 family amino/carboxypeptidase
MARLLASALVLLLCACSFSGSDETETASAPQPRSIEQAVTRAGLAGHLQALQRIADENGGTRETGSAGYEASVDYVVARLRAAGYEPRLHRFDFTYSREREPATLAVVRPGATGFESDADFVPFKYSGSGSVTAEIALVDKDSTTSGCEASDFQGFPRGSIALIERGGCFFSVKVRTAARAGASAVLVFNDGGPGHEQALAATLLSPVPVPALSLSSTVGEELERRLEAGRVLVRLEARFAVERREAVNVLADLPGRAEGNLVLLGAHLDSVANGPGINDNGSGVAALLEIAAQLRGLEPRPARGVRFAFWGAEELGLVGSTEYAESLGAGLDEEIGAVLNFDMLGSPNGERLVYDADDRIENDFLDWFRARGLETSRIALEGRSDHAAFEQAGIPVGGLFSGADEPGPGGRAHDRCYHRSCDTLANVDLRLLEQMADAAAAVTHGLTGAR